MKYYFSSSVKRSATFMRLLIGFLAFTMFMSLQAFQLDAATLASPSVTAQIDASNGAIVRSKTSILGSKVTSLDNNTSVVIHREIFTRNRSTSLKYRWCRVTANNKTGYIRCDLLDNYEYSKVSGTATATVNYRTGPGTGWSKKGSFKKGATITICGLAIQKNVSTYWYKIYYNNSYYYLNSRYVKVKNSGSSSSTSTANSNSTSSTQTSNSQSEELPSQSSSKSDVANALLQSYTNGGSARNVYTFTSSNCSKKFAVNGYNNITTPQGMAFTGDKYYLLYATNSGQRIVTYSSAGKRVTACNFNKNLGHLNGITWDSSTKLCYIFKGNQNVIYTWDPNTGSFGTCKTPYSSSGVGYDSANDLIYCSSQTGIRVYSADGKYTHKKLFSRCKHSDVKYIQDCGSYMGLVFHGVSGADKKSVNYIDVYRTSNGTYLGSIKVNMGEIESCIVNNDGYLELLVNSKGTTDYVWKTPLKISELCN